MTRLATHADFRKARGEAVVGGVIVLAHAGRMALRAHEVPVLVQPGPMQDIVVLDLLVRIEMEPALAALSLLSPVFGQRGGLFATSDGGQQLRIVHTPVRSLVSLGLGADDHDDLHRIAASLKRIDVPSRIEERPAQDKRTAQRPGSGRHGRAPARHHAQADAALQHPRRHPSRQRPSSIAAHDGTVRPDGSDTWPSDPRTKPTTMRFFIEGLG